MRIVYYSYWGTYAAYLAAALHIGTYKEHLPSRDRLEHQLEVCKRYSRQFGNFLYIGLDDDMREIFTLGCKGNDGMVYRAINGFNNIFGIEEPVHFIKVSHIEGSIPFYIETINHLAMEQKFLNNVFHYWIKKRFVKCKKIVKEVKLDLEGK